MAAIARDRWNLCVGVFFLLRLGRVRRPGSAAPREGKSDGGRRLASRQRRRRRRRLKETNRLFSGAQAGTGGRCLWLVNSGPCPRWSAVGRRKRGGKGGPDARLTSSSARQLMVVGSEKEGNKRLGGFRAMAGLSWSKKAPSGLFMECIFACVRSGEGKDVLAPFCKRGAWGRMSAAPPRAVATGGSRRPLEEADTPREGSGGQAAAGASVLLLARLFGERGGRVRRRALMTAQSSGEEGSNAGEGALQRERPSRRWRWAKKRRRKPRPFFSP